MNQFFERNQRGTKIALTAIAASVLTASTLLGYQKLTRSRLRERTKSIDTPIALAVTDPEEPKAMDESLILELLARNIAFFGPDHVAAIRRSRVIVLGTGAIGSWTAVMLARSGIEHLTLIDRGLIRIESLTRHAVATSMDIGKPKVEVMKRYLREIAPQAHIEAVVGSLTAETLDQLVTPVDFVVDTLTDVRDKVLVAAYCKENNIRLVSAMSAGAKADPSLIQVTDISDTMADPLARTYRRQLRKLNVDRDLPVVYSIEKNRQVGKVPDFTTRSLPVLSPVASMFGMALVTYVVVQLGGFTAYKLPANKIRDGVFSRMQKELAAKEEFVFNNKSDHLSVNQVGYVFDELWQGKSVVSGAQDRMLVLTRWDRSKPSSLTNTVVMTKEEAAVHDKLSQDISLVSYYGEAIVNKVEQQFRLEEKLERLWHQ